VTDEPSSGAIPQDDRAPAPEAPAPAAPAPEAPAPFAPEAGSRGAARPIQYKGSDLDAERGPGLGCFWFQVAILAFLVILTPVTVSLGWPSEISAILLFVTIGLLLVTGQTIIFLLRLVAADRRTRRRPLASQSKTVGELEDDDGPGPSAEPLAEPTTSVEPIVEPIAEPTTSAEPIAEPTSSSAGAESNGPDDVRQ
jgi:hypothetical protein